MNNHVKGLAITALGVLCVVPDSLFVRVAMTDPITTAFGRAGASGLFILAFVMLYHRGNRFAEVAQTGKLGLLYVLFMGATPLAFVLAVSNTSVANVVFIFASMPIFAAVFSRIFLGEPIRLRMMLTIAAVIAGLGIIAYGSGESELASWKGDIWALFIACAFAGGLTVARAQKHISMVPALPFAYLGAALVLAPFVTFGAALIAQLQMFVVYGAFIGIGTCLLSIGPRYITSAEVALLVLLESVLAPLLVWYWIGEDPGPWAIVGGAVVIGALLVSNAIQMQRNRRRAAP